MFHAGRLQEAEAGFRRMLTTTSGSELVSALENLGFTLIHQGRHSEAMRAFEGAAKLAPERGVPYSGMAEALLERGSEPGRALELVDCALKLNAETSSRKTRDERRELLAKRACALAQLGRVAEATAAVDEALAAPAPESVPVLAQVYYRAAMAAEPMREEYLHRARAIDPEGLYGKLAAR